MFAPDVLLDNGSYVLLLGSGDREKPREYHNQVENYFFMLRDRPTDSTWLSAEAGACGSAVLCLDSLVPIMTSANPSQAALAAKKGWYLGLRGNEQVVTSAITIFGTVTFSTHEPRQPQPGVCSSDLGIARVYNVNYANAASENGTTDRSEELPPSIGLPPSPVGGVVTLDNGETVPFCIGCRPESPLEGEQPLVPPSSVPSQPKSRVYWYIQR
jgi:type IV pilus assembly protein PilY1